MRKRDGVARKSVPKATRLAAAEEERFVDCAVLRDVRVGYSALNRCLNLYLCIERVLKARTWCAVSEVG